MARRRIHDGRRHSLRPRTVVGVFRRRRCLFESRLRRRRRRLSDAEPYGDVAIFFGELDQLATVVSLLAGAVVDDVAAADGGGGVDTGVRFQMGGTDGLAVADFRHLLFGRQDHLGSAIRLSVKPRRQ